MDIMLTGVVLLVLLVVGIAIPVLAIIRAWIVDQTLDAGIAIVALAAVFILTGFIWQTRGSILMFLGVGVMVAVCSALPLLGTRSDKRALRQLRDEDIAKYRRAIDFDPKNASAHKFLADAYMEYGHYDEAIAEYKEAIKLNPHDVSTIRRKLNDALDTRQGKRGQDFTVCYACQSDMPAGSRTCTRCGATLHMGFLEYCMQPDVFKSIVQQTVIIMLVLIMLLAVFSALPIEAKGCILCATAMVGGFYLLRAIGGK